MSALYVIGVGGIGIRHLEGLLKLEPPLSITAIDPSRAALENARKVSVGSRHAVSFAAAIPEGEAVDLAVIATSAGVRASVIKELAVKAPGLRYLVLEKILFTQEEDYAGIASLLKVRNIRAWVNTPLRLMPVRKEMREAVASGPFFIHFAGGLRHGLVTNAMHYADYASYLGSDGEFMVDTSMLSSRVLDSKRSGYKELAGTLRLEFKNGTEALFTSLEMARPRRTILTAPEIRAVFEEEPQKAFIARRESGWRWREIDAPFLYQSDMTGPIARSILETGRCELPSFSESAALHLALLRPIRDHLRKTGGTFDMDFPFT